MFYKNLLVLYKNLYNFIVLYKNLIVLYRNAEDRREEEVMQSSSQHVHTFDGEAIASSGKTLAGHNIGGGLKSNFEISE